MPDADGWESGLSPSEQLILDFVRQGMRDAEIAVRLGVSVGDGKERIDALVRKVGVRDRDDLAGWSGRATGRFSPHTLGASLALPQQVAPSSVAEPSAAHKGAPVVLLAAVSLVALVGLLLFISQGSGTTDPTDREAVEVLPQVAPEVIAIRDGIPWIASREQPDRDLPEDVGIVYWDYCRCREFPELHRAWRPAGGDVKTETLYTFSGKWFEVLAAPDGSQILAIESDGVSTTVTSSVDGGASWELLGIAQVSWLMVSHGSPEHVTGFANDADGEPSVIRVPELAEADSLVAISWMQVQNRLVGVDYETTDWGPLLVRSETRGAVWVPIDGEEPGGLVVLQDGEAERAISGDVWGPIAFVEDELLALVTYSRGRALDHKYFDAGLRRPVLLNVEDGSYSRLSLPEDAGSAYMNWIPIAVQRGPFFRVASEDCAPIHAEPGTIGDTVACAANGVLLTDLDEREGDWRKVRTPAGAEGWVSDLEVE